MAKFWKDGTSGDFLLLPGSTEFMADDTDCCCDEGGCTASTADDVATYMEANIATVDVTIDTGDYNDLCSTGDCDNLAGTYTLPFSSVGSGIGGGTTVDAEYEDTFSVTDICGATRTLTVTVQFGFYDDGGNVNYYIRVNLFVFGGFTPLVGCRYETTGTMSDCDTLLSTDYSVPSVTLNGTGCDTDAGVTGDAFLEVPYP